MSELDEITQERQERIAAARDIYRRYLRNFPTSLNIQPYTGKHGRIYVMRVSRGAASVYVARDASEKRLKEVLVVQRTLLGGLRVYRYLPGSWEHVLVDVLEEAQWRKYAYLGLCAPPKQKAPPPTTDVDEHARIEAELRSFREDVLTQLDNGKYIPS